jgi:hypothetical protein
MKSKPILFSTEMVQAILEGQKTQTRRVLKPQPKEGYTPRIYKGNDNQWHLESRKSNTELEMIDWKVFQNGTVLWVREKHRKLINCETGKFERYTYYADMPEAFHYNYPSKWKPSIHMPKEACRLFLKITNVRVQRLFEITDQDAIAEGIECKIVENIKEYRAYLVKDSEHVFGKNSYPDAPECSFLDLWESIYGNENINTNPWVWVIEFERVEKPENF